MNIGNFINQLIDHKNLLWDEAEKTVVFEFLCDNTALEVATV